MLVGWFTVYICVCVLVWRWNRVLLTERMYKLVSMCVSYAIWMVKSSPVNTWYVEYTYTYFVWKTKMLHKLKIIQPAKPSPSPTSPSSVAIKSHNIHALSKCTLLPRCFRFFSLFGSHLYRCLCVCMVVYLRICSSCYSATINSNFLSHSASRPFVLFVSIPVYL